MAAVQSEGPKDMFPGLDLYCTDPVQHLIVVGSDLDDLDDVDGDVSDLSDLSVGVSVGTLWMK